MDYGRIIKMSWDEVIGSIEYYGNNLFFLGMGRGYGRGYVEEVT